jgi:hypothetical protein
MSTPYTLYDYLPSGNGYKARLTAKHLADSPMDGTRRIAAGARPDHIALKSPELSAAVTAPLS